MSSGRTKWAVDAKHAYERAVQAVVEEEGCDRSEARRLVAKRDPQLYREFVQHCRRNPNFRGGAAKVR